MKSKLCWQNTFWDKIFLKNSNRFRVHFFALRFDGFVVHIFIERHVTIDGAFWGKFHHPVRDGLGKFVVVRGEQNGSFEIFQ